MTAAGRMDKVAISHPIRCLNHDVVFNDILGVGQGREHEGGGCTCRQFAKLASIHAVLFEIGIVVVNGILITHGLGLRVVVFALPGRRLSYCCGSRKAHATNRKR